MKVVIVPGNGAGCHEANFYPTLAATLQSAGYAVELQEMPDPNVAREAVWLPFIKDVLGADADTLLIGHSSGACAALRLAEAQRLGALVVVSVTPSDMDDANERASGYYSRPWQWAAMRANCKTIVQFSSRDDPLIPIALQRTAAEGLRGAESPAGHTFEYVELDHRSHFFGARQAEITAMCLKILEEAAAGKA